jgi:hypothetical protein
VELGRKRIAEAGGCRDTLYGFDQKNTISPVGKLDKGFILNPVKHVEKLEGR